MTLIDKVSLRSGRWAALLALPLLAAPGCVIEDIILTPEDPPPRNPGNTIDAAPSWPMPDAGAGGDAWPPDPPPPPPIPDPPPNPFTSYFDLRDYEQTIQPQFDMVSCGLNGCHNPLTTSLPTKLFDFPASGSDDMWNNFQTATWAVNLEALPFRAEETALYRYAGSGEHFVTVSNPALLLAWIEDAYARYSEDWNHFDAQEFEDVVQPMLLEGCARQPCHGSRSSGAAFTLFPDAVPGSTESILNLRATTELVDLTVARAEDTVLYRYATDEQHFAAFVSDPAALASWINEALASARQ